MNSNALTSRLHDIQGLDTISPWPLAPGWWMVIALVVAALVGLRLVRRFARRRRPRPLRRTRWARDAAQRLYALRGAVDTSDPKATITELSELLRRIAIARCGRDQCAGLIGRAWLAWLADHDPYGFDWTTRGALLADLPYAPPGRESHRVELHDMIDAAVAWTAQPCASGTRETVHV